MAELVLVRCVSCVSTQDKVLIWQTIIAGVTGAVVIVYTLATWRLQKNAQRQSQLLSDQLDLTKAELKKTADRERKEAEPFIR